MVIPLGQYVSLLIQDMNCCLVTRLHAVCVKKFHQLLAVGRWFPPGTPVSSTRKLISSSFHHLDMTLAVAEALNPNKPKPRLLSCVKHYSRFSLNNCHSDHNKYVQLIFAKEE